MTHQAWRLVGVALGIALALVAVRANAQSTEEARTFGPTSEVSYTVPAFSFTEFALTNNNTSQAYSSDINSGARFCTLINCRLLAPVQLPAGALVTRIEVDGCNTSGSVFSVFLRRAAAHAGGVTELASATMPSGAPPNCVFTTGTLATPETIDNRNNTYFLDYVDGGTNDGSQKFIAVRIFYTLQVSPAPSTASFGDVPVGHPQHQYIEALVRSGITVGCGNGNYCPDDPLTRGQMAVFLSKGLGLHFAP